MKFRPGLVFPVVLSSLVWSLVGLSACSSPSENVAFVQAEAGEDGAVNVSDGGTAEAASEASTDAASSTCEGACKVTSLVVDIGGKKRTLVRSQFGTQPGDGGTELHTESHLGGAPACPEMNSPSPDYTLIITAVPHGAAGRKLSDRDGVIASFLDFKGDLGLPPATKAVSVNLTVVAADTSSPPKWVAFDVSAMFREGEVKGHLYSEHCTSLNE